MAELLSPAGDRECFMAALSAGADAIYVGGDKYGARAYAKNFAQEDLLECLRAAHLLGKKVYLTINTLMKDAELEELVPFLIPYYEEGLDGVIIQDLGALLTVREAFSGLELHASTQMTVTGPGAALLLKKYGVSRVVPARELSLDEISVIKKESGLEIETFVHGAMCYGYSGQCLFPSMLGQRSGNRGRCAGPCRLPYQTEYMGKRLNGQNELYQLSLKDLCTLEVLPRLLDAGIDSFKIEGRMKSPEYVAFVTGMYRKYMDLYAEHPETYRVSAKDTELLKNKFSRGSIQTGYYFMHNGRELVTLDKPGYRSFADAETAAETETYDVSKQSSNKIDLIGHFVAHKDEPICFVVNKDGCVETTVTASGNVAGAANKCAATCEDVKKQLCKTGNTMFSFRELTFDMDDDLFLPNKELNELRRNALSQIEALLLAPHRRTYAGGEVLQEKTAGRGKRLKETEQYFHVDVRTTEQFLALKGNSAWKRVYLSVDALKVCVGEAGRGCICDIREKINELHGCGIEFFLRFPSVTRQKTMKILASYRNIIEEISPDGFCVSNMECLSYVHTAYPDAKLVSDAGMYLFNAKTAQLYEEQNIREHILSYELHRKEICAIAESGYCENHKLLLPVYGYIPVMESAGCLLKSNGKCRNGSGDEKVILIDRQNEQRTVITHCDRCENTIYNSVPLSLHKESEMIADMPIGGIVMRFTTETPAAMQEVLAYYEALYDRAMNKTDLPEQGSTVCPVTRFTKGHFMKGVE